MRSRSVYLVSLPGCLFCLFNIENLTNILPFPENSMPMASQSMTTFLSIWWAAWTLLWEKTKHNCTALSHDPAGLPWHTCKERGIFWENTCSPFKTLLNWQDWRVQMVTGADTCYMHLHDYALTRMIINDQGVLTGCFLKAWLPWWIASVSHVFSFTSSRDWHFICLSPLGWTKASLVTTISYSPLPLT